MIPYQVPTTEAARRRAALAARIQQLRAERTAAIRALLAFPEDSPEASRVGPTAQHIRALTLALRAARRVEDALRDAMVVSEVKASERAAWRARPATTTGGGPR